MGSVKASLCLLILEFEYLNCSHDWHTKSFLWISREKSESLSFIEVFAHKILMY